MAIDTAEKRRSLSGIQHALLPGVTVNATHDVEWRQEAGWGYPGIVPDGAPAPGAGEAAGRQWQDNAPQWTNFLR